MAIWQFRALNPNENSGASISDDNFSIEERTNVEILVRETLQNPLDARAEPDDKVRVSYRIVELDLSRSELARALFTDAWTRHANSGQLLTKPLPTKAHFLLIEDFGTTGLEGDFTDSSVDGECENWNAFWFREGEGAKHTKANGGAGQGKITLYLASAIRTVAALTHRRSDQAELLFACTRFQRNYRLDGEKERWAKEARWSNEGDPGRQATPISDKALIRVAKSELQLRRGSEPGTSFIVPLPQDNLTEAGIREAVINEFFFAICRGRLEVQVGDTLLDSSTIVAAATELGESSRQSPSYREFLRFAATNGSSPALAVAKPEWAKGLDEKSFEAAELAHLKEVFELGEPIVVDFPLLVRPKKGEAKSTVFRVFLKAEDELEKSEELFVRQDLAIDGEKKLKSVRAAQPVMALTFIDDPALSDLLVCAEEPTHRTWNAQRPKVRNAYSSPQLILASVRNAAAKLAQLVAPVGQRDETALAVYFADPAQTVKLKKGPKGSAGSPDKPSEGPIVEIPPAKPKPIALKPQSDGFLIVANAINDEPFTPLECRVEVAYATVHGDPFHLWDAADFWLENEARFPIEAVGVRNVVRDGNELRFLFPDRDASLSLRGFDKNRQLEVRLKYKEVADEADLASN